MATTSSWNPCQPSKPITHFNTETFTATEGILSLEMEADQTVSVCTLRLATNPIYSTIMSVQEVYHSAETAGTFCVCYKPAAASVKDTSPTDSWQKAVSIPLPEVTDATLNGDLFAHNGSISLDSFIKSKQPKTVQNHLLSPGTQFSLRMFVRQSKQEKANNKVSDQA